MSQVALIFGGSGGIGQAVYFLLKKNGMTVYVTSYKSKTKTYDPNTIYCDITSNKDIKKVISYILKKEGKIDIVINSVTPPLKLKTTENLSIQEFKEDINTLLLGGIKICKALIPVMKRNRSGVIINILTSLVSGNASSRMSSYISAKYGLLGFTKCLAIELLPFNISVYGLSPTFVKTRLINPFPDKFIDMEKSKRKDGKLIQPIEVANRVLDIVLNPQKYQTGENIEVN